MTILHKKIYNRKDKIGFPTQLMIGFKGELKFVLDVLNQQCQEL